MSATLTITIINPTNGQPMTGLTNVKLYYGSTPLSYAAIAGISAGGLIGTFTEDPGTGSYSITITNSNQYSIKIGGGVQDEYDDVWISADDMVGSVRLGEYGTGSLGSGASLIGVTPGTKFSAHTLQAVLEELAGSRTSPFTNQNLKWCYDFIAACAPTTGAELAVIHSSGVSNADLVKLHAVTIGAAILNQALTSASVNVTGTNLNTLTAGAASDASALHTHSGLTVATIGGIPSGANGGPLTFDTSGASGNGNGGSVYFDCSPSGSGLYGKVYVANVDSPGGWAEVMTEYHLGSMDYSGTHFLSQYDPSDYGLISKLLKDLDSRIFTLWGVAFPSPQSLYHTLFASHSAHATGAVSTDVAETVWTRTTASYNKLEILDIPACVEEIFNLRFWFYFKVDGNSTSYYGILKIARINGTESPVETKLMGLSTAAWGWKYIDYPLSTKLTIPDRFEISLQGDGSHQTNLSGNFIVQGK
jgi:hypothetical protein